MGISYNPRIVTDGLILALDAGNIKSYSGSGTTWTDLSGNGKNATAQNGVGYTPSNGGGFTFDGSDDHFTISQRETSSQFTYEAFLMPTALAITDYMYAGTDTDLFYLRITEGRRAFFSITAGGEQRTLIHEDVELQNNQVYHIVSIYNGIQLKIYVNNVLVSGPVINAAMTSWGADWIGRWRSGPSELTKYFVGDIYCLRAYNRELTAAEVQQNFNANRGRFGI
jgi:hypothetical protein